MTSATDSREGSGDAYAEAGVDIDKGDRFVDAIKPVAAATARRGVVDGLGGFGAFFDLRSAGYVDPILVAATDGVGTKLKIAIETGHHRTIGVDLVAMCVNDLVVQGAEPLFFLDYYATGHLDPEVAVDVVTGIGEGCRQAGCALIGGETAEMPGMYRAGDYDLAGFAVGAVERGRQLTGADIRPGDIVLGLASSGVHSNGYSLVRRIVERSGQPYDAAAPFGSGVTLGQALLVPTRIYVRPLLDAIDRGGVRGLAHITGGGLVGNVPRILPRGLGVVIDTRSWELPPVFRWLMGVGKLTVEDMGRVFNAGIGMVVIAEAAQADMVAQSLTKSGETVHRIGEIIADETGSAKLLGTGTAWRA